MKTGRIPAAEESPMTATVAPVHIRNTEQNTARVGTTPKTQYSAASINSAVPRRRAVKRGTDVSAKAATPKATLAIKHEASGSKRVAILNFTVREHKYTMQ